MTVPAHLDAGAGFDPDLLPPRDTNDRIGVQSEGCQPLADAWRQRRAPAPVEPNTIADGVALGVPRLGAQTLRDVKETGGTFLSAPVDAIVDIMRLLVTTAGVIAKPAGVVALAGLRAALPSGLIDRDEKVVVEVTVSGFKTPSRLRADRGPIECEGTSLDEIRATLDAAVAGAVR
jgi:threonine synthase